MKDGISEKYCNLYERCKIWAQATNETARVHIVQQGLFSIIYYTSSHAKHDPADMQIS